MRTLKVWGTREELYRDGNVCMTLLDLIKDTYCSKHQHVGRTDKFKLISGRVRISTDLGDTVLNVGDTLVVETPNIHQFIVEEDSIMIEISFAKYDVEDIRRECQGGRIIEGKRISLDELRDRGLSDNKIK
jgi:quercetin dioxygenase-like cupin family protein